MAGLRYLDNQYGGPNTGYALGQGASTLAFSAPQLALQRQRFEQLEALRNAERILKEVEAREHIRHGDLYGAQMGKVQAETRGIDEKQKQAGMLADSVRNISNLGINPQDNPGTFQTAISPAYGATAYLQGMKDPSKVGESLANIQRYETTPQGDRLDLASQAMNRPIPMGQSVGTGVHAPIMVPRGGLVYDESNQPIAAGQVVPGASAHTGNLIPNLADKAGVDFSTQEGNALLNAILRSQGITNQVPYRPMPVQAPPPAQSPGIVNRIKGMLGGGQPQQPAAQQVQPMTATNPKTGQKIISYDGGRTWQ